MSPWGMPPLILTETERCPLLVTLLPTDTDGCGAGRGRGSDPIGARGKEPSLSSAPATVDHGDDDRGEDHGQDESRQQ